MKKYLAVFLPIVALIVLPAAADAHERHQYRIGGELYEIVIGSLNEPITVDDKTGVDFRISALGGPTPVVGLEETLKVEMIAGDVSKITDLSPVHNSPGAYKNVFYPTVPTTLSYRIFGTIEETPVDLTFTCEQKGHGGEVEEDTSEVRISDDVTRVLKRGSFGCPVAKEELGFPEQSVSVVSLVSWMNNVADDTKNFSMIGIGLGAIALLLAGYALAMRRIVS